MRLTYLFVAFCLLVSPLVVAEDASSSSSVVSSIVSSAISKIPSHVMNPRTKIKKEISIEAKSLIVNIGKVKIDIEKNKQRQHDGHDGHEPTYKPGHVYDDATDPIETDPTLLDEGEGDIIDVADEPIDEETTPSSAEVEPADTSAEDSASVPSLDDTPSSSSSAAEDTSAEDSTSAPSLDDTPSSSSSTAEDVSEEDSTSVPSLDDTTSEDVEITPGSDSGDGAASAEEIGSDDDLGFDESLLFEDFFPSDEPSADETVLGENATAAAISVQGGEQFDERGVLILTGPQIFSVTFKIVKEKVITITGSNLSVEGVVGVEGVDGGMKRQPREAVTFIIRGVGFVPGGGLFSEISDMVDGTSKGGMFDFLEPRVFLGAIPLKVVRFTDTVILARFLDVEDQRHFEAGTLLARVKVLHVDIKRQEKKHGPGGDIGILGGEDGFTTEVASVGGLVLPALGAIGGSLPSGPVLGVDGKSKDGLSSSLLGLFAGLRFDTAVLAVSFSEKDASKIRGSFNTLFTDDFS